MLTIPIGLPTQIVVSGKTVTGLYQGWDDSRGCGKFLYEGSVILRSFKDAAGNIVRTRPQEVANSKFTIDDRFQYMEDFVDMTVKGPCNSLIIAGEGGLGKSWTVQDRLHRAGLKEITMDEEGNRSEGDYEFVKGHSSAKGLYRSLYENREGIVVYDDCDMVLKDPEAVSILKGALDSYERRFVSWMVEARGADALPRRFEFKGKVIFLSNLSLGRLPQPLLSRSLFVDVDMTIPDKFSRMRKIAPAVMPHVPLKQKLELIAFLETFAEHIGDLNMRTFGKCCLIITQYPKDWKTRVEYLTTAI